MGYYVENRSSLDQERWATFTVPKARADALPRVCDLGPFKAYKGNPVGQMCVEFYALIDAAGESLMHYDLEPSATQDALPFMMDRSIWDDPSKAKLYVRAKHNGLEFRRALEFHSVHYGDNNQQTFRLFLRPFQGLWTEFYATLWSHNAIVDFSMTWGWHDQDDPEWWTVLDYLDLETGGEEILPYWAPRMAAQRIGDNRWRLFDEHVVPMGATGRAGRVPHGMAPQLHGVVLPRIDSQTAPYDPLREDAIRAAKEGPILAVGDHTEWDGHWFALGKIPTVPPNVNVHAKTAQNAEWMKVHGQTPGEFWEPRRPYGPPWTTGQTGAHDRFGLSKGTRAFYRPSELELMLYCSTDSGLRTFHHREPDGSVVLAENHPGLRVRSGAIDPRISSDTLGKSRQGGGWGWDLTRSGPDGQHRGMNYWWATLALTGNPVLRQMALDFIEMDKTWLGVTGSGGGVPRSLRTMQDIAKLWFLVGGDYKDKCLELLEASLDNWERNEGVFVPGPVKPLDVNNADLRVLRARYTAADPVPPEWVGQLLKFSVPWQEALWVNVALEIRRLMHKIGRGDLVDRWSTVITQAAHFCLKWGCARDSIGNLWPINGLKWLPDGQENPVEYYNLHRVGSTLHEGGMTENTDLLVGGGGWFWWWTGVAHWGATSLPPGEEKDRAQEILASRIPDSIGRAEWLF